MFPLEHVNMPIFVQPMVGPGSFGYSIGPGSRNSRVLPPAVLMRPVYVGPFGGIPFIGVAR